MHDQHNRSRWGWGISFRVPGCVTQVILGALVLGLMILLALMISAFQAMQSMLLR